MVALSRRHAYRHKKSHYATTGSYDRAMTPHPSPQTDRVVRPIEMLAAGDGTRLSLAEVSRRLAVYKASCHSMLANLLDAEDGNQVAPSPTLSATLSSSGAGSPGSFAATMIVWPSWVQLIRPGIPSARRPCTVTGRGLVLGGHSSSPP
jgi:hypothetical protein